VPVVFDYLDHLEESASIYYPGSALGEIVKQTVSHFTKYNLRHARSVITVTKELSEFLQDVGLRHNCDSQRCGYEVAEAMPMQEAKNSLALKGTVLGYVGSLEHWVDLETVVQALPSLDVTLLVVGPGLFTDYGSMIKKMQKILDGKEGRLYGCREVLRALQVYQCHGYRAQSPEDDEEERVCSRCKVFNYLACGRPVLSSRMNLPGEAARGRDILLR